MATICHNYKSKNIATIHYWNNGYITELKGYIIDLLQIEQLIKFKDLDYNKVFFIKFSYLYQIENANS